MHMNYYAGGNKTISTNGTLDPDEQKRLGVAEVQLDIKPFRYGMVMDIDRMLDTPCDVDVTWTHNGEIKEFTYAEFFSRLGFKE